MYAVVRESFDALNAWCHGYWVFSAIIGTYATLTRAEEVAGASKQALLDNGVDEDDFRFTVKPVTYYDE